MTDYELFNHVGRFRITQRKIYEDPQTITKIMGQMVIVRAEMLFIAMAIEYQAYSRLFDRIEEGVAPPLYLLEVDNDGHVTAQRIER